MSRNAIVAGLLVGLVIPAAACEAHPDCEREELTAEWSVQ